MYSRNAVNPSNPIKEGCSDDVDSPGVVDATSKRKQRLPIPAHALKDVIRECCFPNSPKTWPDDLLKVSFVEQTMTIDRAWALRSLACPCHLSGNSHQMTHRGKDDATHKSLILSLPYSPHYNPRKCDTGLRV